MFKLRFKINKRNSQRLIKKKYNVRFIPNSNRISWGHSNICPWKIPIYNRQGRKYWTQDSDGDGVIDAWDCKPFDKRKQGMQHERFIYLNRKESKDSHPTRTESETIRTKKVKTDLRRGSMIRNQIMHKELEDWNRKFAAAELYEKYGVPKSENPEEKTLNPKHTEKFYIKEYEKNLKEALQKDQLNMPIHQRRMSMISELSEKGTDKIDEPTPKKKSKTIEQEDMDFNISKADPTNIYSKIAKYESMEDED